MVDRAVSYDHAAYLARIPLALGVSVAGSGTTNCEFETDRDLQIRNVVGRVKVAGTSATNTFTVRKDTTSIGLITMADSAAGFIASTGDLNVTLSSGECLNFLGGTDATGVATFMAWVHIPVDTTIPV